MHILTTVFFNAPSGGLHENVLASSCFMLDKGHSITVVCKKGVFASRLKEHGIKVIESDFFIPSFSETLQLVKEIHDVEPISLVHAHPFLSRQFGMLVAEFFDIPFVLTMHGRYLDSVPEIINKIDAVFAVSEGIRQHIIKEGDISSPQKIHVIPNTPDDSLFKPLNIRENESQVVTISLVTRLDDDKSFIIDIFYQAVKYASEKYDGIINWKIVGAGTLENDVKNHLSVISGHNKVDFLGWLEGEALRDAYQFSDAVIAPGRCVLEALSCRVPAIALGSKGYVGLVGPETWQEAVFTNFGGLGDKAESYKDGSIQNDLDILMQSSEVRKKHGDFGLKIAKSFFNHREAHLKLLDYYLLVQDSYALRKERRTLPSDTLELRIKELLVERPTVDSVSLCFSCDSVNDLSFAWYLICNDVVINKEMYKKDPVYHIFIPGPGHYKIRCFVKDEKGNKISFIGTNFNIDNAEWLRFNLNLNLKYVDWLNSSNNSMDYFIGLHSYIRSVKPISIVEFGQGESTLIIAEALRQNGFGKLISIQHSQCFVDEMLLALAAENLTAWVELRVGELKPFLIDHVNDKIDEKKSVFYSKELMSNLESIGLIVVDDSLSSTCQFTLYPILPMLLDYLADQAQVWMVKAARREEKNICEFWSEFYEFDLEYSTAVKGLGILRSR